MFGRPLRSFLAAFGIEVIPRDELERERQATARATEALELRIKLAKEERASLLGQVGRLEAERDEAAAQLWGKIAREQQRVEAVRKDAERLQAAFEDTTNRLWAKIASEQKRAASAEAKARRAAHGAVAPSPTASELQNLKSKLQTESILKAAMKERFREQSARSNALELDNEALRGESQELMLRLAALEAGRTRDVADDLLTILGAFPARRSELVSDRLVENLFQRSGLKGLPNDDPAGYYRLGRALQVQGASELAAAAYRKVGPRISEFLAQPGPDGRPVSGPDFLIIGAPRAGTTWLKRALSHHPDVMMLAGEPQFFAMTSALGPDYYVGRFAMTGARFLRRDRKEREPARPIQPIHGEKSTTYLSMSESQISLCAALYPKARIICLVRDPIARAWSHIKHDGLGRFGEQLRKLHEQPYWQSLDAYVRHGRYERHLGRWARRYPPEQIHLVDFARLATDTDAVYREVLTHIGAAVDPTTQAPERVHHSSDSEPPERLKAFLERAYANDRFDIPWLRQVMEQAAETGRRQRIMPVRKAAAAQRRAAEEQGAAG